MGYSIKTKLKDIMKSEAAMDVLEKYVPGVKQNPQLKLGPACRSTSLRRWLPICFLRRSCPRWMPICRLSRNSALL